MDPFKLFNIPKQNVYVPPEIVEPAAEAAIRYLKPPEPIVLTEIIEPETEKLNQIDQQMQELQEEKRKFEEEKRKFEEERRRSFIGRKSPRAIYGNSSTPSPDSTQSPRFGRKSPGNKRPVFVISNSSSSASSSSESEDENETTTQETTTQEATTQETTTQETTTQETTTPKTTILVNSSTSEEEELANSMKEIKKGTNLQRTTGTENGKDGGNNAINLGKTGQEGKKRNL